MASNISMPARQNNPLGAVTMTAARKLCCHATAASVPHTTTTTALSPLSTVIAMLVLALTVRSIFEKNPDAVLPQWAATAYQLIAMLYPALLYLCGLALCGFMSVSSSPLKTSFLLFLTMILVFNYDCVVSVVIVCVFVCQPWWVVMWVMI